jgi:ABC-type xylose transport system permease subunit
MHDPMLMLTGVIAVVTRAFSTRPTADALRDRGAVSIEQVLWYAAAAISVAVVAAIIWSQIRDTASTPVQSPSAP